MISQNPITRFLSPVFFRIFRFYHSLKIPSHVSIPRFFEYHSLLSLAQNPIISFYHSFFLYLSLLSLAHVFITRVVQWTQGYIMSLWHRNKTNVSDVFSSIASVINTDSMKILHGKISLLPAFESFLILA